MESCEIWTLIFSCECKCFDHWAIEDINIIGTKNFYKDNFAFNIGICNFWIVLQNQYRNLKMTLAE